MSWKVIFFLSIAFIILFSSYVSACTPDYACKDWSSCDNGVQTRVCVDKLCGQPNTVDRRICNVNNAPATCEVKYSCDDWTSCTYYDKTNDIITSQIKYSGIQTRFCTDTAGCADSFSEERACSDAYKVNFVKVQQCGTEFLVAQDPGSNRPLAKVNVDAWRQQFLDIAFVQSNFTYCPSCYDGFKDGDETGIDCGGSCKACNVENKSYAPIVLSSWIFAFGLFFSFLSTFIGDRRYVLRFLLYRAYVAIERRDIKKLRKLAKSISSIYSRLSDSEKQGYVNEVSRFKDRLADFRIRVARESEQ